MPNLDIVNGQFLHTHTTDEAGDYSLLLTTQNTFIDKNIAVKISTPSAGALTLNIADNSATGITIGTLNGTKYPLTANLGGTITSERAGWVTADAHSVSENAVVVGTIDKTTITTSADTGNLSTYFNSQNSATGANVVITPKYTATAGYTPAINTALNNDGTTYWTIKTATPTFKAAPTGHSTATFNNITYSSTNNGIKVQTAYSIDAVNIYYNAAATGWISKAANADTNSDTTAKASTDDNYYYITGINVPTATNFTLTTANNSNTDNSIITITNNSNRNIEITNKGNIYARQTTSGAGNVYVRPYGAEADIQIVDDGAMMTTSVSKATWSKNDTTKVATMGTPSSGDGYIGSGSIPAATFSAVAESGVTYLSLDDAVKTSGGSFVVPELAANGILYIKQGYIDNVSISLAHLIADASGTTSITGNHIRENYSAYDANGNLIVGTIPDLAAATYHPSTSDQTIAIGSYISGVQTFKAVTITSNAAAMVAYGSTIKIGDSTDDDCVATISGTFTQAGTQSTNQSVAGAGQILSGYSAWVNGAEVLGNMANAALVLGVSFPGSSDDNDLDTYITTTGASSSSYDVRIIPNYKNNTAGYLPQYTTAQNGSTIYYKLKAPTFESAGGSISLVADSTNTTTKRSIYTSTSLSYITISDSEPTITDNMVYIKISSTGQVKTTNSGAGAIKSGVTIAATGNKTRYVGLKLYDGAYSTGT